MTAPLFQGLPPIPAMQELFRRPQWVAWKRAGPHKIPIDPKTGQNASVSDPSTWGTYQQAAAYAQGHGLPGVGFVLHEEQDLYGVDLDAKDGPLDPSLEEIVWLAETYTERSPSGAGRRLFARGTIPHAIKAEGVEIYRTGRFLTVTGAHVHGTPLAIQEAPRTLEALLRWVGDPITSQGGRAPGGFGRPANDDRGPTGDNYWGRVNRAALDNLDRWVPDLFPRATRSIKGWRVSSRNLSRNLEEDLSLTRDGIVDFGVHDLGDAKRGRRSSIELVIEYGAAPNPTEAARWLCDRIGVSPESLGWIDWSKPFERHSVPVTYPASHAVPFDEGLRRLDAETRAFSAKCVAYAREVAALEEKGDDTPDAVGSQDAWEVSTGGSKTGTAARMAAAIRRSEPANSPLVKHAVVFAVPTHMLGEQIIERDFSKHGLSAKVYRGREAWTDATKKERMCWDLEAVRAAQILGENIEEAVCSGKDPAGNRVDCVHYGKCPFQGQKKAKPDVWLVAHEMLWHAQAAFGKIAFVIVDEAFWKSAIREPIHITVEEFRASPFFDPDRKEACARLDDLHARLARAIDRHEARIGGLRREHLTAEGISPDLCTEANQLIWSFKKTKLYPGMPEAERKKALAEAGAAPKHIGRRSAVWTAVRDFLRMEDAAVSGQVRIEQKDNGDGRSTVLHVRRRHSLTSALANKPALILDATLPDLGMIRPFFPNVQVTLKVELTMPYATIRYVPDAPTAARKFSASSGSNANTKALYRYILKRWLEFGRQKTLVICQMGGEEKLKALGLPSNVHVEHYNNIKGIDKYKDARLLILVGRILPEPDKLEPLSGALHGVEPRSANVNPKTGGRWYDSVTHGLRMKDGRGIAVRGDQHPDPNVEAIRWQTCEAESLQALGRVRPANRKPHEPVQIDILSNVCLPVTVDEVLTWAEATADLGGWCETAAQGVVLESPADRLQCFPDVWSSLRAAEREPGPEKLTAKSLYISLLKEVGGQLFPPLPPWLVIGYRTHGNGQRSRRAVFDLSAIRDPRAWLEERLGPLAHYEVVEPAPPSRIVAAVGASAGAAHVAARSSVTLALLTDRWRLGGGAPRGEPITAFIELPDVRPVPRGFWIH